MTEHSDQVAEAEVPTTKRHYKPRQQKAVVKSEAPHSEFGAFSDTQKTIQIRLARIIADRSDALNQLTEAQITYAAAKARVDRLDAERRDLISFATQISSIGQPPTVPQVPVNEVPPLQPIAPQVGYQNPAQAWTTQQYGSLPAQAQQQPTSLNDSRVNIAYASPSDINSL